MARIIPKRLGIKLLILGACSLLLLIWLYVDGYCPFRRLIGIPCPTCGMSRAWLAAFRLDLASAFRFHPMFWSVPLLVLFPMYDGRPFPKEKLTPRTARASPSLERNATDKSSTLNTFSFTLFTSYT